MNQLIEINTNEAGIKTVNARNLHAFLEVGKDFSSWVKARIEQYGFVEGEDYLLTQTGEQMPSGTKYKIDYHCTIDMAKELAMVERNEKGKQARQYFIECERIAKEVANRDQMHVLNDPAAMRGLLLTYTEKVLSLESKVHELTPKATALDRIATADGSLCLTDAAKELQMRPKDFIAWMSCNHWIYKRAGSANWIGYQDRIQCGLLEHKANIIIDASGGERVRDQVRVTAKGLARLAETIQKDAA